MIIPCQKLMLAVFSDSVVRTNESTFPQSESGTGSEVALQTLDYRNSELASFFKDTVWHDRRSLVLEK